MYIYILVGACTEESRCTYRSVVPEEPAAARAREADMFGGYLRHDQVSAHDHVHSVLNVALALLTNSHKTPRDHASGDTNFTRQLH